MNELTNERLKEIDARCERATPGPWSTEKPERDSDGWAKGLMIAAVGRGQGIFASPPGGQFPESDRKFIAHARQDVPDLLGELRTLREQTRWRDVKDELPEQYESALIYSCGGVEEAQWNGKEWYLVRTEPDNSAIFLSEQVTHWQPLPQEPK